MKTLNLNTSFELSMLPDRKTHGKLRAYAFDSCQKALNCSLQRVERLSSRRTKLEILEERYRHDKGNEDLRDELDELQGDIWRANYGIHADPTIHQDYKDQKHAFDQIAGILDEWRRDAERGDFEDEWWLSTFNLAWIQQVAEAEDLNNMT
ncbi:hypothetical protein TI39_contig4258g00005 [Zymoseptoria brevis]|uniref:Uncharacterized protein n=1 Tax=Zymoseptoria brevis TaxID=1047168 RepID=A0A0F4G8R1_9PEZI|nr:hypothetical protein TI39_contig4258g00005 [Zymoseptoria brevis]